MAPVVQPLAGAEPGEPGAPGSVVLIEESWHRGGPGSTAAWDGKEVMVMAGRPEAGPPLINGSPGSGIAWSRLPALQLGPLVRPADDVPDVGGLGVGVARAVKGKLPDQAPLHDGELGRSMGVTAQIIAQ